MLQTVCNMHNRSHHKRHHQSFDDDNDDGRLEEKSERSVRLEHFFENVLKDNEAKFMQAKTKIPSLDFDIFSPTIFRKNYKVEQELLLV